MYVLYYVNTGLIGETYQDLPSMYRADYIIVQSKRAKESCKGKEYYNRIHALGSPKIDKVINLCQEGVSLPKEWGMDIENKKSLLLNTTINDLLHNEERLLEKLRVFFEDVSV